MSGAGGTGNVKTGTAARRGVTLAARYFNLLFCPRRALRWPLILLLGHVPVRGSEAGHLTCESLEEIKDREIDISDRCSICHACSLPVHLGLNHDII